MARLQRIREQAQELGDNTILSFLLEAWQRFLSTRPFIRLVNFFNSAVQPLLRFTGDYHSSYFIIIINFSKKIKCKFV
jgi:hypothetical protein